MEDLVLDESRAGATSNQCVSASGSPVIADVDLLVAISSLVLMNNNITGSDDQTNWRTIGCNPLQLYMHDAMCYLVNIDAHIG